jgi:hypothetical protein
MPEGAKVIAVCTPDYWHALPAILACQVGKDAFLTRTP